MQNVFAGFGLTPLHRGTKAEASVSSRAPGLYSGACYFSDAWTLTTASAIISIITTISSSDPNRIPLKISHLLQGASGDVERIDCCLSVCECCHDQPLVGAAPGGAGTGELQECCRAASCGLEQCSCSEAVSHPGNAIVCVACERGPSRELRRGVTPRREEMKPAPVSHCHCLGSPIRMDYY